MARLTPEQAGGPNVCAFLDMLAWSEIGAELLAKSDDGYNVLVGATPRRPLLFSSYTDHPNVYNRRLDSTAAGRYQQMHRDWPHYRALLRLPDFGPESQDRLAIQHVKECGAFKLAQAGHIVAAVTKVSNIWASLPGNSYGQPQRELVDLRNAYSAAGGVIA